jgi:hypothetical protein
MQTLQDDIGDLDRMVDTGAQKDAIRSQIRLIAREVSALETDYASLAGNHASLHQEHSKLKSAETKRNNDGWDALHKEAEKQQKLFRSHQLNYKA